jgi:hypothetical protein
MVAEEVFLNCYNFNPISQVEKGNFKVSYKTILRRSQSRVCGSAKPEPKEIISAPQHW